MRVLFGCEFSGVGRRAFAALGHEAWSCDLLPSEDNSENHIQGDVLKVLEEDWDFFDLLIAHPPCTRLANSGVRWLHIPPKGKTLDQIWEEFYEAVRFYEALRNSKIKKKALENPVMHKYAKAKLNVKRQIVQPWWFGDEAFKATGFELIGLPKLEPTNKLDPPKIGTEEHKKWSRIHRMPPGPDRWKERSRTFEGIAQAMAEQWG